MNAAQELGEIAALGSFHELVQMEEEEEEEVVHKID